MENGLQNDSRIKRQLLDRFKGFTNFRNIIIIAFIMKIQPLETHTKITEVESRLNKHQYLSKMQLPGTADAVVFQKLQAAYRMPSKQKYENFYHWYITMVQFAPKTIEQWIQNDNTLENDKLIVEVVNLLKSLEKSPPESPKLKLQFLISITVKGQIDCGVEIIKKKLQNHFRSSKEKVGEYIQNQNQLRLTVSLGNQEFQHLKDMVSRWQEVDSLEIKKMKKQSKN